MARNSKGGRRLGKSGGAASRPLGRQKTVRVKTARGRKSSSTRWLQRQLNDPYVAEAQRLGYRSRAAWKLIQLDERFGFLKPGQRVVDLGAAPGGWTQIAAERIGAAEGKGRIVAIDVQEMDPVPGAEVLCLDIFDPETPALIQAALGGLADVILSDMAAPTTGHKGTDHLRSMALCEETHALAHDFLAPGGTMILKAFQGGAQSELMVQINRDFTRVKTAKPDASRPESPETYIVAEGYRGRSDRNDE